MFDDKTEIYETLIDWEKRLANEAPFYRDWFDRVRARRVLDVACGTGRHAAMFHSWGLHLEAADLSPGMLRCGRERFGEHVHLRWVERGFDQPVENDEPFDVALCVGNSLALAPDMAVVERAVAEMLAAVRSGGIVVIHVLNLWHLPDGPCHWQKCKHAHLGGEDVTIVKGVHRSGSRGYVDLVVASREHSAEMQTQSVPFLGIELDELKGISRRAGATDVHSFGNYRQVPYDRANSEDLIFIAVK
ncbi:MAG: class I SAM-dependent methyltransferase [Planctomycetales bacterium]|nr:class I SAM-dependent methyltransferase [Planctomycetales bacterium]